MNNRHLPPVPCIACGKALEPVMHPSENQPYAGTAFTTGGHYGSCAFDPMTGHYLEINICDVCLNAAQKAGRVLLGRSGRRAPNGLESEGIPRAERPALTLWDGTCPEMDQADNERYERGLREFLAGSEEPEEPSES